MATSEIALPRGFALNEYRIESTLGVGGFGLTYLATDSNLDRKVAIKEYLPGELAMRGADHSVTVKSESALETFKWGRSRFLDESRTLATFQHPNIVRVMRFFEANQTAYMVMEFIDGMALSDWMGARRPLSEPVVLSIARPLLDGLEMVHKGGYLHRDIKPANIYIRADGSPVLLDFGSARLSSPNTEMTAIVTPGYAPLEQYHSQGNQGPWSDLYSIGAVLYWMVTGYKPVESTARARTDGLMPASQAGDLTRYSADLLKTIDWALSPAEESRPQSVADLRRALSGLSTVSPSEAATQLAAPPAGGAYVGQHAQSATTAVFDRATLDRIEAELAPHIGPIAPLVVRSAAKKALTLPQLAELTGAEIADEKVRAAFVKKFSGGATTRFGAPTRSAPTSLPPFQTASRLTSRPASHPLSEPASRPASSPASNRVSGPASQPASGRPRFDAAILAKAEARLANYIGAVAKVVVRRAAAKARDEAELYLLISDEIEDKDEKKAFIRKAMSVSHRT